MVAIAAVAGTTPKQLRNFLQRADLPLNCKGTQGVRKHFVQRDAAVVVLAFDLFSAGLPARLAGLTAASLLSADGAFSHLGGHASVSIERPAFLAHVDTQLRAATQRVVAPPRGRPPG